MTLIFDDDPEFEPPSYSEPGRILFELNHAYDDTITVLDNDGSAFWIIEGGFPDDWIKNSVELELDGHYVLEGITGSGHTDYSGEYDEEWEFKTCRRASEQEIQTGALDD